MLFKIRTNFSAKVAKFAGMDFPLTMCILNMNVKFLQGAQCITTSITGKPIALSIMFLFSMSGNRVFFCALEVTIIALLDFMVIFNMFLEF